jgi:hypothetical protein
MDLNPRVLIGQIHPTDIDVIEMQREILQIHKERAIFRVYLVIQLLPQLLSPKFALEGPPALPLLPPPRIAYLNQGQTTAIPIF